MFNTIRIWIHRIKSYDELNGKLKTEQKKIRVLTKKLERATGESNERLHNIREMARILSDDTWKEGDNMMEAIETAQERKYLKEHAEDFLMIMNGNVPEMAARELFEYFEVEVPDSGNIEIQTAKRLYYLSIEIRNEIHEQLGDNYPKETPNWDILYSHQKDVWIQEANKLWIIP